MQIDKKNVRDWGTILIDTGMILALFASKNGSIDPNILFVKKLLTYLCAYQTGDRIDRRIYISTITVGEILTQEIGQDKVNRILKVLDSDNVEFLSFDIETALQFNVKMQPYLEKTAIHKKAAELGFVTKDYGMARQWISKDYMIAMTGFTKNVDVIITLDKNTFYPICADFETTECILAYPELFKHSEQFIFEYDYANVDNFLNNKSFQTLNEIEESKPAKPVQQNLFGNQVGREGDNSSE
jgi:hypothetical protein